MNVYVLATVLKMERLPTALLLFKTARIGFPTSHLTVYGNGLEGEAIHAIAGGCHSIGARFIPSAMRSHGEFIESLVRVEKNRFWICDTDIVFKESVEGWFQNSTDLFAGRFEPEFYERWTNSNHVARLHPSLMWFNPVDLRAAIRSWPGRHMFFNTVEMTLFRWHWVPVRDKNDAMYLHFYDTCAGLYHALGGTKFTEAQNRAFAHLYCGTYADLIAKEVDLRATHEIVCKDLKLAELLLDEQNAFYENNQTAS